MSFLQDVKRTEIVVNMSDSVSAATTLAVLPSWPSCEYSDALLHLSSTADAYDARIALVGCEHCREDGSLDIS
eukprot:1193638-Prorocentrum_minimum.AAC.2